MSFPRPQLRKLIHSRDIQALGYEREDGLWDIDATMTDAKTYSFDNVDRGGIRAGEPIHGMRVRVTVTAELEITAIAVAVEASPFHYCNRIEPAYDQLIGQRIGQGWHQAVRTALGKTQGCTHLTDLLLGPIPACAYQTVAVARRGREKPKAEGAKPALLDTCHALATASPVVKRHWPDFYTGA